MTGKCLLINKDMKQRINFGRGKKFVFKKIGNSKILVFKKGVEMLLTLEEFDKHFKVCNR